MDVKRRVLAARLAVRVNENREYGESIGLSDHSDFRSKVEGGEQNVYAGKSNKMRFKRRKLSGRRAFFMSNTG